MAEIQPRYDLVLKVGNLGFGDGDEAAAPEAGQLADLAGMQ